MHAASYPWTMNLISVPSSVLIIYAVIAIPILYSNFRAHRIVSCRLRANSFEELYPLMSFLWYFGFHTQCTVHRKLSFLSFFRFQSGASSLVLRSNSPVHDTWFGLSCPYRRHLRQSVPKIVTTDVIVRPCTLIVWRVVLFFFFFFLKNLLILAYVTISRLLRSGFWPP